MKGRIRVGGRGDDERGCVSAFSGSATMRQYPQIALSEAIIPGARFTLALWESAVWLEKCVDAAKY